MSYIVKFFFETRPFQVCIGSDNHGEPQTAQCGTDPMVRGGKATGSPGSRLSGRKMAWESFKKGLFIANFIVRVYVCLNWKQLESWFATLRGTIVHIQLRVTRCRLYVTLELNSPQSTS